MRRSPWLALILLAALGLGCELVIAPAPLPSSGDDAGTAGCEPITCESMGAECGYLDDGCGTLLPCGTCSSGTCGAGGKANRCGAGSCTRRSCSDLGASCGDYNDGCDGVLACGGCGAGRVCKSGKCACAPQTDAELCGEAGRSCGPLTATDRCGASRSVASCGACTGSATCGGGGTAGVCGVPGCMGESDAQLCAKLGRSCGPAQTTDGCGVSRTVASCGSCTLPAACQADGTCQCPAESDADLCTRLGKNCGTLTGTDNCGAQRTVFCGACSSGTCGGGGTPNVCGCTAESNSAFCARLGKNCGTVTANDNCGAPRTAGCGTCSSGTCGGGGTPHVCGCAAESDSAFCARLAKNCGTVTANDNCGAPRTASCGTCSGPQSCGGTGTANVCGCNYLYANCFVPVASGTTGRLNAVSLESPTRGYAVGESGLILEWDGTGFSTAASPTTVGLHAVWALPGGKAWAVGDLGTVLTRTSSGNWSFANGPASTGFLYSVYVDGAGRVWTADDQRVYVRAATGGTFTVVPLPSTTNKPVFQTITGSGAQVFVGGYYGALAAGSNGTLSWKQQPPSATSNCAPCFMSAANPFGSTLIVADFDRVSKVDVATSPITLTVLGTTCTGSGCKSTLYGSWGESSSRVWTVGANGEVGVWTGGTSLSLVATGTTKALRGMGGIPGDLAFIVGDSGTILKLVR